MLTCPFYHTVAILGYASGGGELPRRLFSSCALPRRFAARVRTVVRHQEKQR